LRHADLKLEQYQHDADPENEKSGNNNKNNIIYLSTRGLVGRSLQRSGHTAARLARL
jgi:hypothetical protein